jgi:hypothetical protein
MRSLGARPLSFDIACPRRDTSRQRGGAKLSSIMVESLQPGTHLSTQRLGYRHHGLYAGEGRVLHYGGLHRFGRRGPVEEVSLARFARGRGFNVVPNHDTARFKGHEAVERARTRLGEDDYRLLSNNCEHFVTWCLSGEPRSAQIELWRARIDHVRVALRRAVGRLVQATQRQPEELASMGRASAQSEPTIVTGWKTSENLARW